MKVIVAGSRSKYLANPFILSLAIHERLRQLPRGTTVVHGASPGGGVDQIADQSARALGYTVIPVPIRQTDRNRSNGNMRRVPILRTMRMFDEHPDTDLVLVWQLQRSPGSGFTIAEAKRRHIPLEIYTG